MGKKYSSKEFKPNNVELEFKLKTLEIVEIQKDLVVLKHKSDLLNVFLELDDYQKNFVYNHSYKYIGKKLQVKYLKNFNQLEVLPIKKWTIVQ